MSTYKSVAIMRELVDVLKKKVAATMPIAVESFDSSSNPVVTLSQDSTPAAGEKVVVIRCQPLGNYPAYSSSNVQGGPVALDSLGNTANQYSHHVIEICTEANYAGTTDNVADILTPTELGPVFFEAARRGCQVKWYVSANGTVPATSQMTAANLKDTEGSLYWQPLATI